VARRRSRIREAINRYIYQGRLDYRIVYVDRDPIAGQRLAWFEASRVRRITGWAVYLDDDYTVIPLHRIVEIRDPRGRTVWKRSGGQDTGSS